MNIRLYNSSDIPSDIPLQYFFKSNNINDKDASDSVLA